MRKANATIVVALVLAVSPCTPRLEAQTAPTFAEGLVAGQAAAEEKVGWPDEFILGSLAAGATGWTTAGEVEEPRDVALIGGATVVAVAIFGFALSGHGSDPPPELLVGPEEFQVGFREGYRQRWKEVHQGRAMGGALLAGAAYFGAAWANGGFDDPGDGGSSGLDCKEQGGITVCVPGLELVRVRLPVGR